MITIRWLNEAQKDFEYIFTYLEKISSQFSERFFEKIQLIESRLKKYPSFGRIVPELQEERIREVLFDKYRMQYFLKSDDMIEILSILHQRQEFKI